MQQERTAFQLVQLSSEAGVPYPPVLLKLATSTSSASSTSENTQSASQLPASQSSPTVSLVCSATRFVNGRQQLVDFVLSQEEVLEAGRTGLQSPRMTIDEVMDEILARLRKREYMAKYRHEHSEVKVTLNDLSGLPLKFDFSAAESTRATPAFVLAFEAASALAEIVTTSEKSAIEAADALKARDRDLRISERKLQNTQQELSDKSNQYTRLLATGGLSVENGTSPGKNGRRAPSVVPMDVDDGSPRKKRKAAAPTLTGAGRIARKKVTTAFIDSDDGNSGSEDADDSEEPAKKAKTVKETASSSRQAERAGSATQNQEEEHEQAGTEKHKTLKADPAITRSGRTAQKQVDKGFVDDDSATDED